MVDPSHPTASITMRTKQPSKPASKSHKAKTATEEDERNGQGRLGGSTLPARCCQPTQSDSSYKYLTIRQRSPVPGAQSVILMLILMLMLTLKPHPIPCPSARVCMLASQ